MPRETDGTWTRRCLCKNVTCDQKRFEIIINPALAANYWQNEVDTPVQWE
jgi:hypothetical protein